VNVRELIEALEDLDAPDSEVRLAFQPNWPLQYGIGDVVVDDGHEHVLDGPYPDDDRRMLWVCEDDDCDIELEGPADGTPPTDVPAPTVGSGTVYIGEAGQIYDAPYLPGSAAAALGWRS